MEEADAEPLLGLWPIKTLSPEQVFYSLEQVLSLPVARADGSARFNGLRERLISRMNEAASNKPDEFRAGIPQALLLMNGKVTTDAKDLDQSRTLRGLLDAPFLDTEAKLTDGAVFALAHGTNLEVLIQIEVHADKQPPRWKCSFARLGSA